MKIQASWYKITDSGPAKADNDNGGQPLDSKTIKPKLGIFNYD
jgi:hypothetical protein